MRIKKRYLLGVLLLVGAISFAYAYLTFLQLIGVIGAGGDLAAVEPVGNPAWGMTPARGQIGRIETTDLFVVTPNPNYAGDLRIRLDIVNAAELEYRYFKARAEVFADDGSRVGRAEFVTLRNGSCDFDLPFSGSLAYTVTITGGSFYYVGTGAGLSPAFYCQVSQW